MKKIILYIIPFIIAIILFGGAVFFINQENGKGALQVTSSTKADVFLNGKSIGMTPLCRCEKSDLLKVAEYNLRIVPKDKNLFPYEEKININKGTLTVVDKIFGEGESASVITLNPIEDKITSEIMVITFPDQADIFLDNNPKGKSSTKIENVLESDHELKITKDGFIEKTLRISTTKGFQLKAIIYLGASSEGTSPIPEIEITPTLSPSTKIQKVIILETPTGFLRVRSSSSASTSEIGRVNPGETYDILEEEDGWFKIKLESGEEGWISSQYAEKQ